MSAVATVVVVNHDGGEELLDCLSSVRASGATVEVIVVDNASQDGSVDRVVRSFPDVCVIRNAWNRGFAAAANQGAAAGRGAVIVLVNPDATVAPTAIESLIATLDDTSRAGAVGAMVRNPDGSVQPSKRGFPSIWQSALHATVGVVWPHNPGTRAYLMADVDFSRPVRVGWVSASAVAFRRTAFESVGGFDEAFFFFVEDADLCKRLRDAGWEIWFDPRAEVVHAWGGSWTRKPLRFLWMHHANLWRYVRKHKRGAWALAYPAIGLGIVVRFALLALRWLLVRRSVPAHTTTRRAAS